MQCLQSKTRKHLQSKFIDYFTADSKDLQIAKAGQSLLILKTTFHATERGLYLHIFIPAENVQSQSLLVKGCGS